MKAKPHLQKLIGELKKYYGVPEAPISTDPFELILYENVAYLVSDEQREKAFATLRQHVGTKPHQILAAAHDDLLQATTLGGMLPDMRAKRLREIALIAIDEFNGDLGQALKQPLPKAKK